MKHLKPISQDRLPQKAQPPIDVQFIIDILNAIINKKTALGVGQNR